MKLDIRFLLLSGDRLISGLCSQNLKGENSFYFPKTFASFLFNSEFIKIKEIGFARPCLDEGPVHPTSPLLQWPASVASEEGARYSGKTQLQKKQAPGKFFP